MDGFMFDLLADPLGLPVKDIWEYAILAVIGIFTFCVGWDISCSGAFDRILYWVARVLAFFVLWAVAYVLLAVVQWVIAHLVMVCLTIIMAVAVIVIASVTGSYHHKKYYREVTV